MTSENEVREGKATDGRPSPTMTKCGRSVAERLLAIGKECSAHLKEPFRSIDHEDLLYDEKGLPKKT
jgi:hypothetical protein